ncbi:RidA family protein [Aspergillus brunneoviolaceus CBS 621.78]|uniref:YjgF-like protein n=1 Tax=Aspergillus brunneoviolaceus CBS 621.78 TaxID=1450534 RepID=A0ACD1G1W0_9EURO|nr:YjgF-like protein [Aspergillus brunneoviolaceus CBS 621.78]RAH43205.1 YjgF-like protein [Aspergillus brunneoviolaceus CBS 621.78]
MNAPRPTQISTPQPPILSKFLSPAHVVGNVIHCSGQLPIDPNTGRLVAGCIQARAAQILLNLNTILTAAGSNLDYVIKLSIFLTDMRDWGAANAVLESAFMDTKPVCTCVAVEGLPGGSDLEVECSALIARPRGSERDSRTSLL